jgi:hypothetical protein
MKERLRMWRGKPQINKKARMVFFPELQVENVRDSIGIF